MLEKREYKSETISQNTFVKSLCKMITLNPNEAAIDLKKGKDFQAVDNLAFSYYFKEQQDAVILKILLAKLRYCVIIYIVMFTPNNYEEK